MFLPQFDVVFCDLLLNRRTATWNLFVLYNKELNFIRKTLRWWRQSCVCPLIDHRQETKCANNLGYYIFHRDEDNNDVKYKCWWKNKRSKWEIFCSCPPTWLRWRNEKIGNTKFFQRWKLQDPVGRVQFVVFEKKNSYLFQIAQEKSCDYLFMITH